MNKIIRLISLVLFAVILLTSCGGDTAEIINVDNVLISKYNLTLFPGQSYELTATVIPQNATDKELYWKSSNSAVASVADGVILAHGVGVCTISCETSSGVAAICTLKVIDDIEYLVLSKNSAILSLGESLSLSCTTYPESDAGSAPIEWSSTDESVATCIGGTVIAVGVGACTVKATYVDGTVGVCAIAVVEGDKGDAVLDLEPLSKFEVRDLPITLKTVSAVTGEVQSVMTITEFVVERSLTEGSLIDMYVHIKGTKVFDKGGADGTAQCVFNMSLYRENDEHCETIPLIGGVVDEVSGEVNSEIRVGEQFEAIYTFYADISIGQREFYMILSDG